MNTPTDTQLKQALAKMLPREVGMTDLLAWKVTNQNYGRYVLDTELLHLCWLVEETLKREEQRFYTRQLHPKYFDNLSGDWLVLHATWQQRTIALAKVKGIEII